MDKQPSAPGTTAQDSAREEIAAQYNPFVRPQLNDPYRIYHRARHEAPVFYSKVLNSWIVTRYDDIIEILKDSEHYSSMVGRSPSLRFPPEVREILKEGNPDMLFVAGSDPPAHTRLRKFLNKTFVRRIPAMEPVIRAHANALVDSFIHEGKADLLGQYVNLLPLRVISEMQGIPQKDLKQVKRWFDGWMVLMFGDIPLKVQMACARDLVTFQKYYLGLIEDRRKHPQDDLLSALVHATIEGEQPLDDWEIITQLAGLNIGGNESTSYAIGNALRLLLQHPEQLRAVRENPALSANAMEEALRMDTSVQGLMRVTKTKVTVGGVTIPEGALVQMMFASGNRDAAQFPDPERFDIHRDPSAQLLSFGWGIHFCIGAPLARLQGRIAIETLVTRLPEFRLQDGVVLEYMPNLVLRGLRQLPVHWKPGSGEHLNV